MRKRNTGFIKSSAIIFMVLFFIPAGFTQEKTGSLLNDTINLEEVVVTGTAVRVNRRNVPMSVSVVSSVQLSGSVESALLPVLNGRVPGLFVTERGVMGFGVAANAAGQISIRGIGGSPTTGVLMLIDGHPQFMGIFGHPLPDSYVTSDVDRVEVIRGPASILYGSNAMGGVINIITKKQSREGFSGNAHLMYGSYKTMKTMASGGYKNKNISLFASVNHDRTDGHRPNSEFSITNGYLKFSYTPGSHLTVNSDLSLAHFKASDPGPDTVNSVPGYNLDITRGYLAVSLDNDYARSSGTAKIFYNFGEHKITDGFHSTDINYGFNLFQSLKLIAGNSITVGADFLNYGGRAENELAMGGNGILFTDTAIYDAGLYGFIQQDLSGRLTVNAGLRLQKHEVYGLKWIPAGGFAFRAGNNTTLKASVARGFRSPTLRELFVWDHNENLSPETIMNYEASIMQWFYNRKLKLELTGYIVKGDNLIISVPMQGLMNAGVVSNKGIEFASEASVNDNLRLNLTYSFTGMDSPVYATPKHHLFMSLDYNIWKLQLMPSFQYVNHLDTDPSAATSFQSYVLFNTKVMMRISQYADLFISGENLLNQKYENNRYYTMPGITVFAGLKIRI